MKTKLLICAILLLFVSTLQAEEFFGYQYKRALQDKSDSNQVLVIGSMQVSTGMRGKKVGPRGMSFIRTLPVVGPRFVAVQSKDNQVFAIDGLTIGETYKLFDYHWIGSNKLYTYSPGIVGTDILVKPSKPGIYYVGAFIESDFDYATSELKVLKKALPLFRNLPGWKKEIESRIKELEK